MPMLPAALRILLIAVALAFLFVSFLAVSKKWLQMHYSLIWMAVSFGMILLAVFPGILTWLIALLGIKEASNLVFLLGLLVLLAISFSLTILVSKQSLKIRRLTQMLAIVQKLEEDNDEADE